MTQRTQRKTIFLVGVLLLLAVVASYWFGTINQTKQESETNRANTAVAALESACAEVQRLGGHCATDPASLKGDTGAVGPVGPAGPAGRDGVDGATIVGPSGAPGSTGPEGPQGATGAQGDTGPAGPAGPAGQDGAPGPTCPTGYHAQDITVRTTDGPVTVLACVRDEPTPTPNPQP
jgi:hypothetical protein